MGFSSDGMLCFGFQVGGEDEKPEWLEGFEDFDDFICSDVPANAGWKERKVVRDACPADLFVFCSYDYPMYILGVRGAEHCASRGYIVEVGPKELTVEPAKIEALKAWCEANKIEWQEPKWLLCSMYG